MNAVTSFFRLLHTLLVILAKTLLAAMVLLISANVFMRYVLNSGITWSEEVALVFVVWFTFIALALGVKQRLHISLCLLPEKISPKIDLLLSKLTDVVILFMGYIMIHYGWILVQFTSRSILPATGVPASVLYFPLVLSGVLVLYEGAMDLLGLDKRDADMDDKLSQGRCASDA